MESQKITEGKIYMLDDDCLAEIFSHLPLKKRLEIEEGNIFFLFYSSINQSVVIIILTFFFFF